MTTTNSQTSQPITPINPSLASSAALVTALRMTPSSGDQPSGDQNHNQNRDYENQNHNQNHNQNRIHDIHEQAADHDHEPTQPADQPAAA